MIPIDKPLFRLKLNLCLGWTKGMFPIDKGLFPIDKGMFPIDKGLFPIDQDATTHLCACCPRCISHAAKY
jgi:hypothetical protein